MDATDELLVDGLKNGAGSARERLYRTFHRRVFAYLSTMVLDPNTVWDLTHDVFEKAFHGLAHFDGEPAALAPWLLTIARNTALDHFRAARRSAAEDPRVIDRRREGEAGTAEPDWGDHDDVHHALAALPRQQREVLLERYRYDRGPADIGEALGKSADAIRHIEQRALDTVRRRIRAGPPLGRA